MPLTKSTAPQRIPNCNFEDTVNLTNAKKFTNGSYLYEDYVVIPPDLVGLYDYEELYDGQRYNSATAFTWVVCRDRNCIKFCCHPTKELISEMSRLDEELAYDPYLKVTLRNGTNQKHAKEILLLFRVYPVRVLSFVAPDDDDDKWEYIREWHFISSLDGSYLSKRDYCLMPFKPHWLFLFMAAFFWLSVISFDLWQNFRITGPIRIGQRKRFIMYSAYAWANDWSAMIYFFGINLVIILLDTVFFVMTLHKILVIQKEIKKVTMNDSGNDKSRNLRLHKNNVGLFLRLLLIMGITWLLDIFSYIENQLHPGVTNPLYYISDFMNAMTGLLIFICFVLKPKVLKLMKRRYEILREGKMKVNNRTVTSQMSLSKTQ
ncbi:hypothetical protein DOY81_009391 [Sarcophaga bullata]|nr:hypothetical protein DOY81_009391 [Sarcophaga bullata]